MPITRRRLLFAMLSTNAIGMPVNGHKFLMTQPYDEAFHLWAKRQLAECGKIIGLAKLSGSVAELDEALVILGVFNLIGAKCSLTNGVRPQNNVVVIVSIKQIACTFSGYM